VTGASLLLHGARIHVPGGVADAMAVRGGTIAALGRLSDVEPALEAGARRIDLAGATVLPGFHDPHVHVWKVGQLMTSILDLRGSGSLDEVLAAVARRAADTPRGAWILGRGWNEADLGGNRPTRGGLDRAAPDHPVALTRTCAHIHAANSAALRVAAIGPGTRAPDGGAIDIERGLFYETAWGLLQRAIPPPSPADVARWIVAGAERLRSLGVTAAGDAAVDPPVYAAYRRLESERRLPIRMALLHLLRPDAADALYELPPPHAGAWLRCDTVKLFADGALSGGTAAVSAPYRDGTRGILRLDAGAIEDLAARASSAGYRVAAHAIGDRAIDAVLDGYERLASRGLAQPRPRIEHLGLPTLASLRRACRLDAHVVTQPIFLRELEPSFRNVLSDGGARCYPLREMLDAGLPVAFSSDGPVVRDLSPLSGIAAAAEAGVTVAEAVAACTRAGAAVEGAALERGALTVGRRADAVVLDGDPFAIPPAEIAGLRVRATLVDGRLHGGEA
jgi:predicted amidohydrolase YtcJ